MTATTRRTFRVCFYLCERARARTRAHRDFMLCVCVCVYTRSGCEPKVSAHAFAYLSRITGDAHDDAVLMGDDGQPVYGVRVRMCMPLFKIP